MGNIKNVLFTFGKAQCSAWAASAVDFGVTFILGKLFSVWYPAATFVGALSGGIINCIINYRWVFHAIGQKKRYVVVKYFVVWSVSILLNTWGTYLLTEGTGLYFLISKAIIAALVAVMWNYQMQRLFVFKPLYKSSTVCEVCDSDDSPADFGQPSDPIENQ